MVLAIREAVEVPELRIFAMPNPLSIVISTASDSSPTEALGVANEDDRGG